MRNTARVCAKGIDRRPPPWGGEKAQGQAHVAARLRRRHARVVCGSTEDGSEGGTWQRDREDPLPSRRCLHYKLWIPWGATAGNQASAFEREGWKESPGRMEEWTKQADRKLALSWQPENFEPTRVPFQLRRSLVRSISREPASASNSTSV